MVVIQSSVQPRVAGNGDGAGVDTSEVGEDCVVDGTEDCVVDGATDCDEDGGGDSVGDGCGDSVEGGAGDDTEVWSGFGVVDGTKN